MQRCDPIDERNLQSSNRRWGDLSPAEDNNILCIEIYSDEIKRVKLESDGSIWMYIGALFLPIEAKGYYIDLLNNQRCIKNRDWIHEGNLCPHPCGYHGKNDTEIHYKELHRSNARFRIAENWIENILCRVPTGDRRKLYINILGLNLSNLNAESFGHNNHLDMVIYNRFYRTVLLSGLNYFFRNYKVVINKIYHDKGEQSSDGRFPWHAIHNIELNNEHVSILPEYIEFIDSDHRISKRQESNFIQLLDLALGAIFCCLHNPSEEEYKRKIGRAFKPTLIKLLDRKKAPDSSAWIGEYYKSNYYRTYQVSFFPVDKIETENYLDQLNLLAKSNDDVPERHSFYYDRRIILGSTIQKELIHWF